MVGVWVEIRLVLRVRTKSTAEATGTDRGLEWSGSGDRCLAMGECRRAGVSLGWISREEKDMNQVSVA